MKETIKEFREDQERNKEYLREIPNLKKKIEEQNVQINQMSSQISTLIQYIRWVHTEKMKNLAEEEKCVQLIESPQMIVNNSYVPGAVGDTTCRLRNTKRQTYMMKKKLIEDEKLNFQSIFSD